MVDYTFYTGKYHGDSIPGADFPRLEARARAQLARYERIYRVDGDETDRDNAVCAMADALYYFETAANGGLTTSSSIGSVSSSTTVSNVDTGPKAQAADLYRCACIYLDIYRGCRQC